MATGPGKYDEQCTAARINTGASGVILIVLGGMHGTGFSMQTALEISPAQLADLLENVIKEIRSSIN